MVSRGGISPKRTVLILLYFHTIVRLTAKGLSISPSSKPFVSQMSLLVSDLNDKWPATAIERNCMDRKPKVDVTHPFGSLGTLHAKKKKYITDHNLLRKVTMDDLNSKYRRKLWIILLHLSTGMLMYVHFVQCWKFMLLMNLYYLFLFIFHCYI